MAKQTPARSPCGPGSQKPSSRFSKSLIFIFAPSAFLCGQIDHRNIFLAAKERKERKKWIKKSIIPFLIFIFIFAFSAFLCGQIDRRNMFF
jgi:hypothetical protein